MKYKYCCISVFILLVITQVSCRKLITIGAPETSINSENIYENDATAISVLTALYAQMGNSSGGITSRNLFAGAGSLPIFAGLSSDELTLFKADIRTDLSGILSECSRLRRLIFYLWSRILEPAI